MSTLSFIAFSVLMAAILYLHFSFAHKQWQEVKGQQPSDIDSSYVKREDYFAQSFRSKVQSWLDLPGNGSPENGGRTIVKGLETIQVNTQLRLPDKMKSDNILVVQGDFTCGADCELSREIRAAGNAEVGARTHLQAIAADGTLSLGEKVRVARWVDSAGELKMGRQCVVLSRVTSQTAVRLAIGAEAQSVFAPEVTTDEDEIAAARAALNPQPEPLEIPPPDGMDSVQLKKLGFDPAKLSPLGAECWVYAGPLRPQAPILLRSKLVVKGDCVCPDGSVLEADLKACGSLTVGDGCECHGNLIAETWLFLGPGTRFTGVLHAGTEILLSRRVRGEAHGAMVGAYASGSLYIEAEVTVAGIVSGGERVRVIPSLAADEWRRRHKIERRQKA